MAWADPRHALVSWRVFGIPVHIDRNWLLIVAMFTWSLARRYFPIAVPGLGWSAYWAMGLAAAVLLFGCVLLHELGHSLVARHEGIPVACVTLFLFGGVAQITRDARRPSVEMKVALAGPLVSAMIAGSCFYATQALAMHRPSAIVTAAIVHYLALMNTALLCFNLLPGFPLDGGRIVRAGYWALTGNLRQATRVASLLGAGLGIALFILGAWAIVKGAWVAGVWYLFLGFFLRDAALTSYRAATDS